MRPILRPISAAHTHRPIPGMFEFFKTSKHRFQQKTQIVIKFAVSLNLRKTSEPKPQIWQNFSFKAYLGQNSAYYAPFF